MLILPIQGMHMKKYIVLLIISYLIGIIFFTDSYAFSYKAQSEGCDRLGRFAIKICEMRNKKIPLNKALKFADKIAVVQDQSLMFDLELITNNFYKDSQCTNLTPDQMYANYASSCDNKAFSEIP